MGIGGKIKRNEDEIGTKGQWVAASLCLFFNYDED